MARDEFSAKIVKQLALFAGYTCSFPDCDSITVSGGDDPEKAVITGEASHITAASEGGPRYDSRLTHEQRSSAENGIWLCKKHARLIDVDHTTYPTALLRKWKANHELRTKLRHAGKLTGQGILTRIDFSNFHFFRGLQTIDLSDKTVLLGGNGDGKTLICEVILALAGVMPITKWIKRHNSGTSYLQASTLIKEAASFRITHQEGNVGYFIDGSPYPVFEFPFKILHYGTYPHSREGANEMDLLIEFLKIQHHELRSIVRSFAGTPCVFVSDIIVAADEKLKAKIRPDSHLIDFEGLSSSEQQLVQLELCLKIASFYSRFKPTLLIIEQTAFPTLDEKALNQVIAQISELNASFQIFLTFHYWAKVHSFCGAPVYEIKRVSDTVREVVAWSSDQGGEVCK